MAASINMRPVLKICEYGPVGELLNPLLNIERDEINFSGIDFQSLSEEQSIALSWVFHLFCDCRPDAAEEWAIPDPFINLQKVNVELRKKIIESLGVRYRIENLVLRESRDFKTTIALVQKILSSNSSMGKILGVFITDGEINWGKIGYGGYSGGLQSAISWAYSIMNKRLPDDLGFRNPINNFGVMDSDLQERIISAFALSLGFEIEG